MNLDNSDAIEVYLINNEFWYIDGSNRFRKFPFGGTLNQPTGLFSQTEDGNIVTNTTVKTSIIRNGIGSLNIPPKGFNVGDSFHAKLGGVMSCSQNETLDFHIESNGVVLVDSEPLELSASTNKAWELELDFTIRDVGDAGTASIKSNGQFVHNKNGNNVYEGLTFNTLNNTTFDTNVANNLDIYLQWGSASASNSIVCTSFVLYRTFFTLNYDI